MGKLKQEMGGIVMELIRDYNSSREDSLQDAWDYVQAQVNCCGWASFYNWTDNAELMNRPEVTYPCSCEKRGRGQQPFHEEGLLRDCRQQDPEGQQP